MAEHSTHDSSSLSVNSLGAPQGATGNEPGRCVYVVGLPIHDESGQVTSNAPRCGRPVQHGHLELCTRHGGVPGLQPVVEVRHFEVPVEPVQRDLRPDAGEFTPISRTGQLAWEQIDRGLLHAYDGASPAGSSPFISPNAGGAGGPIPYSDGTTIARVNPGAASHAANTPGLGQALGAPGAQHHAAGAPGFGQALGDPGAQWLAAGAPGFGYTLGDPGVSSYGHNAQHIATGGPGFGYSHGAPSAQCLAASAPGFGYAYGDPGASSYGHNGYGPGAPGVQHLATGAPGFGYAYSDPGASSYGHNAQHVATGGPGFGYSGSPGFGYGHGTPGVQCLAAGAPGFGDAHGHHNAQYLVPGPVPAVSAPDYRSTPADHGHAAPAHDIRPGARSEASPITSSRRPLVDERRTVRTPVSTVQLGYTATRAALKEGGWAGSSVPPPPVRTAALDTDISPYVPKLRVTAGINDSTRSTTTGPRRPFKEPSRDPATAYNSPDSTGLRPQLSKGDNVDAYVETLRKHESTLATVLSVPPEPTAEDESAEATAAGYTWYEELTDHYCAWTNPQDIYKWQCSAMAKIIASTVSNDVGFSFSEHRGESPFQLIACLRSHCNQTNRKLVAYAERQKLRDWQHDQSKTLKDNLTVLRKIGEAVVRAGGKSIDDDDYLITFKSSLQQDGRYKVALSAAGVAKYTTCNELVSLLEMEDNDLRLTSANTIIDSDSIHHAGEVDSGCPLCGMGHLADTCFGNPANSGGYDSSWYPRKVGNYDKFQRYRSQHSGMFKAGANIAPIAPKPGDDCTVAPNGKPRDSRAKSKTRSTDKRRAGGAGPGRDRGKRTPRNDSASAKVTVAGAKKLNKMFKMMATVFQAGDFDDDDPTDGVDDEDDESNSDASDEAETRPAQKRQPKTTRRKALGGLGKFFLPIVMGMFSAASGLDDHERLPREPAEFDSPDWFAWTLPSDSTAETASAAAASRHPPQRYKSSKGWSLMLADTGATSTIVPDRTGVHEFTPCSVPISIANGSVVHAIGRGYRYLQPRDDPDVVLRVEVLVCPSIKAAIVSPHSLCHSRGSRGNFTANGNNFTAFGSRSGFTLADGTLVRTSTRHRLPWLAARFCDPPSTIIDSIKSVPNASYYDRATDSVINADGDTSGLSVAASDVRWHPADGVKRRPHVSHVSRLLYETHVRLGHCNFVTAVKVLEMSGVKVSARDKRLACEICSRAKLPRRGAKKGAHMLRVPAKHFGEILHLDLLSMDKSRHGRKFALVIVDDYSGWLATIPLKRKSDTARAFQEYLDHHSLGRTPDEVIYHQVHSDNESIFRGKEFRHLCDSRGARQTFSAPYHANGNSRAEQGVKRAKAVCYALLQDAKVTGSLWEEAMVHGVNMLNRLPTSFNEKQASPLEMLIGHQAGRKEGLHFLEQCLPWGVGIDILRSDPKSGNRSRHGMYLGTNPLNHSARVLCEDTKRVVESVDYKVHWYDHEGLSRYDRNRPLGDLMLAPEPSKMHRHHGLLPNTSTAPPATAADSTPVRANPNLGGSHVDPALDITSNSASGTPSRPARHPRAARLLQPAITTEFKPPVRRFRPPRAPRAPRQLQIGAPDLPDEARRAEPPQPNVTEHGPVAPREALTGPPLLAHPIIPAHGPPNIDSDLATNTNHAPDFSGAPGLAATNDNADPVLHPSKDTGFASPTGTTGATTGVDSPNLEADSTDPTTADVEYDDDAPATAAGVPLSNDTILVPSLDGPADDITAALYLAAAPGLTVDGYYPGDHVLLRSGHPAQGTSGRIVGTVNPTSTAVLLAHGEVTYASTSQLKYLGPDMPELQMPLEPNQAAVDYCAREARTSSEVQHEYLQTAAEYSSNDTWQQPRAPHSSATILADGSVGLGFLPSNGDVYRYEDICHKTTSPRTQTRTTLGINVPTTWAEAKASPESKQWIGANATEMNCHQEFDTFRLRRLKDMPRRCRAVKLKPVFRIKTTKSNSLDKFRLRWVYPGYRAVPGRNVFETYTPTMHLSTFRTLLAYWVPRGLHSRHLDLTTAFLHAPLEEEFYAEPPPFLDGVNEWLPGWVVEIRKSLYGIPQSSRNLYGVLKIWFESVGMKTSTADPAFFHGKYNGVYITIGLYCDDIAVMTSKGNEATVDAFVADMQTQFKVKDEGQLEFYLGFGITHMPDGSVYLDQSKAANDLLVKHSFSGSGPTSGNSTPLPPNVNISAPPTTEEAAAASNLPFRQVVGGLMWLIQGSRPSLAFAGSLLCRRMSSWGKVHWNAASHSLKHLRSDRDRGIFFPRHPESKDTLSAWCDSSHQDDKASGKSTGGHVVYLNGAPIAWKAALSKVVCGSTAYSEFCSIAEAIKEIRVAAKVCAELGIPQSGVRLYNDNKPAVLGCCNDIPTGLHRHVAGRFFYAREACLPTKDAPAEVDLQWISTDAMIADIFTKSLDTKTFRRHRESLEQPLPAQAVVVTS